MKFGSHCAILYHVSVVFQRLFVQSVRIGCNVEFFVEDCCRDGWGGLFTTLLLSFNDAIGVSTWLEL